MRVCVIQSNYIPWKGYFDIIANSDVMIFYDDVQYTKNDWRNRNRIKTSQGLSWLTVPVGSDINRNINEVAIPEHSWQKKHWRSISINYGSSRSSKEVFGFMEDFYENKIWTNLSEMNQYFIQEVSKRFLGATTVFRKVEEFHITGNRVERLLDLLTQVKATSYLTGPSALDYLNKSDFEDRGIKLLVKEYDKYPVYQQKFGAFEHGVSIIDLLMLCGTESKKFAFTKDSFYEV